MPAAEPKTAAAKIKSLSRLRPTLAIQPPGMANGALTLARAELLAQHSPPQLFGTVNGRLARPVNLAQAFTPLGMGVLFSLSGNYRAPLLLCAGLADWAAWTLRPGRCDLDAATCALRPARWAAPAVAIPAN